MLTKAAGDRPTDASRCCQFSTNCLHSGADPGSDGLCSPRRVLTAEQRIYSVILASFSVSASVDQSRRCRRVLTQAAVASLLRELASR